MDAADLLPLLTDLLPRGGRILVEDRPTAEAVRALDPTATVDDGSVLGAGSVDVVLLLAGEVAAAGESGPAVIDAATRRARPGGLVAIAVPSAVQRALTGGPSAGSPAGPTSGQLVHAVQERGLEAVRVAAPGAAARLAGRPWAGPADLHVDSTPGLLDAGDVVLVVGRTPRSPGERSATFFASITRRIVAASALCTAPDGRLLVVFDSFKQAWTLPGGLVDAGESPIDAAVRESREEGGVDVVAGALLGVFAHVMPDRIHLVYDATPTTVPEHPVPLHPHEIDEVRWVAMSQVEDLLDAHMARKVQLCLRSPGGTHAW